MILSKTAKLNLLGLTLTLSMMNSIAANVISPSTPTSRIAGGVLRGMRLLQNDLDSADDDPSLSSNELSMDTDETSSSSLEDHNSIDNNDDDEDERQFQYAGFVAPRARQCNTRKFPQSCMFSFIGTWIAPSRRPATIMLWTDKWLPKINFLPTNITYQNKARTRLSLSANPLLQIPCQIFKMN